MEQVGQVGQVEWESECEGCSILSESSGTELETEERDWLAELEITERIREIQNLLLEKNLRDIKRELEQGSEESVLASIKRACVTYKSGKRKEIQPVKEIPPEKETVKEDDLLKTMVMQNIQFQQLMLSGFLKNDQVKIIKENRSTQTEEVKKIRVKPIVSTKEKQEKTEITNETVEDDPEIVQERIENTKSRSKIVFMAVYFIQILRKLGLNRKKNREKEQLEIINLGKMYLLKHLKENSYFINAAKEIEGLDTDLLAQDNNLFTFFKSKSKNTLYLTPIMALVLNGLESIKDKSSELVRALQLLLSRKIVKSYYYEVELEILPQEMIYKNLSRIQYTNLILYFFIRVMVQMFLNPIESFGIQKRSEKVTKNFKILLYFFLRIVRGVCTEDGQLQNISPELLTEIDSINSNTFTDQGFKKLFKSYAALIQESEVRVKKWVDGFNLDLSNSKDYKITQPVENDQKVSQLAIDQENQMVDNSKSTAIEESLAQILSPTNIQSGSLDSQMLKAATMQEPFGPKTGTIPEEDVKVPVSDINSTEAKASQSLKESIKAPSTHTLTAKAIPDQFAAPPNLEDKANPPGNAR